MTYGIWHRQISKIWPKKLYIGIGQLSCSMLQVWRRSSVQCTQRTVYRVHSVQCTVYTAYSVQRTTYNAQRTIQRTPYNLHRILHTVHRIPSREISLFSIDILLCVCPDTVKPDRWKVCQQPTYHHIRVCMCVYVCMYLCMY
jgi:hypothetical protein